MPCLAINVRIFCAAPSLIWIIFLFVVGPHPHDLSRLAHSLAAYSVTTFRLVSGSSDRPTPRPVATSLRSVLSSRLCELVCRLALGRLLLLVVGDGGLDRVLRQHRTMDLDRRQT